MITKLYPATPEKAAFLRLALTNAGVKKARCKVMRNGALRLVLNSVEDKPNALGALVEVGALDCSGMHFTDPRTKHAWNGPVEIFVRFDAR